MKSMHIDVWVYMVNCNSLERIILFLATTCMSKYDLFHVNVKKILYQFITPQRSIICTQLTMCSFHLAAFHPSKCGKFNFVVLVEKSFMSEFSAINLNCKEKMPQKDKNKREQTFCMLQFTITEVALHSHNTVFFFANKLKYSSVTN